MRREFLYGRNCVAEALSGRRKTYCLYVEAWRVRQASLAGLLGRARELGVPVKAVDEAALRSRVGSVPHQGVVAEVSQFPYERFGDLSKHLNSGSLVLVLDHLEDPANVGSLLRTAEAVGVAGVVLPSRRAAPITPTVSHASAGAVEHLRVSVVPNVADALRKLKALGLWVVGLENRPEAAVVWQAKLTGGLALVVGSEGKGISPVVLRECDLVVRLPMVGRVSSLNAAVAGSIALYEVLRQRSQGGR